MKNCDCDSYGDLEFSRDFISSRIKATRKLKKRMTLVSKHPDGEHHLYRCGACRSVWQSSRAWNWGAEEYLFRVPEIAEPEWAAEPYADPDELLIYTSVLKQYLDDNDFTATENACREEGCPRAAIEFSVFCVLHHIAHAQSGLPPHPRGRLFGPYAHLTRENIDRYVSNRQEPAV